ncbi:MAG: ribose 5-phosphate isomerase B [Bacteroidota bacterium]
MMKIAIGCDHAGFEYKEIIKAMLNDLNYTVTDFGTHSTDSMDYPDTAHPVAINVENKESELGILICGSGNGVNMAANKHQGIRAALCWTNEISSLARTHNDANVLSLPSRFIDIELAKKITMTFLTTQFEGGRHQNRVNKIGC